MVHMNTFKNFIVILPMLLSGAPLSSRPFIGTLLLCASIFAAAACVPAFKHRENIAVFLLVWLCGAPFNLHTAMLVIRFLGLDTSLVLTAAYACLIALMLFSTEEIVFGILARLLWRRQYKITFE